MSYQSGSAATSTDLLQQLVTWLVSIGWNQDRSATEGAGWTATLDKSGNFVNLRAVENEASIWHLDDAQAGYGINMYLGTGYNGSNPWNNQAGGPLGSSTYPVGVGMQLSAGPFSNYYFFGDATGDNVVVVVEKTPGLFVYIGWGLSIQKAGSFTGGPYFFGTSSGYYMTYPFAGAGIPGLTSTSNCPFINRDPVGACCGFVRADVDSYTGKWVSIFNGTASSPNDQGYGGKQGDSSARGSNNTSLPNFPVYGYSSAPHSFDLNQTSELDGRANLLPLILWALRDGTTTGFSMLGTVPNVFYANAVGNGFSNADEYVLGSTTYKLFPNFAVVKQ
jgi:hypothetical protein